MVVTGNLAWFALMNRKTRTARRRFRGQTRPPLERGYRAPRGVVCSHAAAGSAPRAHQGSSPARRQLALLRRGRPADRLERPSSGLPGRTARTHAPGQMDPGQNAPDRRFGDGTPVNKGDGFSASQHLSRKRARCPSNRGNFSVRLDENSRRLAQDAPSRHCPGRLNVARSSRPLTFWCALAQVASWDGIIMPGVCPNNWLKPSE